MSDNEKKFGEWFFKWHTKKLNKLLKKIDLNTKDIKLEENVCELCNGEGQYETEGGETGENSITKKCSCAIDEYDNRQE